MRQGLADAVDLIIVTSIGKREEFGLQIEPAKAPLWGKILVRLRISPIEQTSESACHGPA